MTLPKLKSTEERLVWIKKKRKIWPIKSRTYLRVNSICSENTSNIDPNIYQILLLINKYNRYNRNGELKQ